MPTPTSRVTAHIKKVSQDIPDVTTLVLSEMQLLELIRVVSVALREKAVDSSGSYHLAIWKRKKVAKCTDQPACEGGAGSLQLVRQKARRKKR